MKELTWAGVAVFTVVVSAIVIMFTNSTAADEREKLIGFLQLLVGFVVGGTAAGVAGWHRGYARGKGAL